MKTIMIDIMAMKMEMTIKWNIKTMIMVVMMMAIMAMTMVVIIVLIVIVEKNYNDHGEWYNDEYEEDDHDAICDDPKISHTDKRHDNSYNDHELN